MNKISATIASLAVAAASLFTSGIASASTAPGTCDFGVPSFPGFSCHDSDDISAKAGPAHTDNGPLRSGQGHS